MSNPRDPSHHVSSQPTKEHVEGSHPESTPSAQGQQSTLDESTRADLQPGEVSGFPMSGRYVPVKFHARGGLGEVHVAEDVELHRTIALKQIRPEYADLEESRRRFVIEAEVTARLEHPGIVPIYGLVSDDQGRPQYAMRFIQGESLTKAIAGHHSSDKSHSETARSLRQLLARLIDVCNAIAYAHSRGVIHRDLKPENVLLGQYGESLVVDWGLAKVGSVDVQETGETTEPNVSGQAEQTLPNAQLSQPGRTMGTPQFMSPEQAEGRWDVLDHRSDVYALGAMLYVMLTGQLPFPNEPVTGILENVKAGQFQRPRERKSDVPHALEAICLKAMALEPDQRYDSALELASELELWLSDESVRAWRDPWSVRCWRWMKRHRTLVSTLAALLVTALIGLTLGLVAVERERGRTDDKRRLAEQEKHAKEKQRQIAEVRKQEAIQARKKAEEHLQEARHQNGVALGTLIRVVGSLNDRLTNVPGAQKVRLELLRKALVDLEQVTRRRETALGVDQTTLRAHGELGWFYLTLGNESEDGPGATKQALQHFEQALKASEELAEKNLPDPLRAQQNLAVSLAYVGQVKYQVGDFRGSLGYFQRNGKIQSQLVKDHPENPNYQRNLSVSLGFVGDVQKRLGQRSESLTTFQRYRELHREMAQTNPKDWGIQRELSIAHERVGDAHLELDEPADALKAFEECHRVRRHWASQLDTPQVQSDLVVAHTKLGSVQRALGQFQSAAKELQQAREILEKLLKVDSRNRAHYVSLSAVLAEQGLVRYRMKDYELALTHYQECVQLAAQLHREIPTTSRSKSTCAATVPVSDTSPPR